MNKGPQNRISEVGHWIFESRVYLMGKAVSGIFDILKRCLLLIINHFNFRKSFNIPCEP